MGLMEMNREAHAQLASTLLIDVGGYWRGGIDGGLRRAICDAWLSLIDSGILCAIYTNTLHRPDTRTK